MPKTLKKQGSAPSPTLIVKPPPPPAQEPPPVPAGPPRQVVYDKLKMTEYSSTSELGPLTVGDIKVIMRWETEQEFQVRKMKEVNTAKDVLKQGITGDAAIQKIVELCTSDMPTQTIAQDASEALAIVAVNPNIEPKAEHFLFGDVYHCLNTEKKKVRCWNNANNRPFDMGWCEDLIHTHLSGKWVGPMMMPGVTVNGETVRVSQYNELMSGQHSLTGAVLADEYLQISRKTPSTNGVPVPNCIAKLGDGPYPAWDGHAHVVMETIVITGLTNDPRLLDSIDYVKPRTVADLLYTRDVFRNNTPVERKEMTRMLSSAIDMLWSRTDTKGYKTHPEVTGFLERHRKLMKCVEHLFAENRPSPTGGRRISKLRISAGHAAALCYLMGSSGPKTDGDAYRWMSPPSERGLDWSLWDKACDFWVLLASSREFMPVRTALVNLQKTSSDEDENQGLGGNTAEKLAIIAKAWEQFRDHPSQAGPPFADDDLAPGGLLCLAYSDLDDKGNKLPDGEIKLLDIADFYGIDCPEVINKSKTASKKPPEPPPPSQDEIERGKEEAIKRRQQAAKK